ncbi:phosphatidate cytidylyltransferase [Candidatus Anaplasma sp. TIGMIC]|nr:phosphatidate cytidylyltransferase [Candidatus Anaplasma sp. TIGMIC]
MKIREVKEMPRRLVLGLRDRLSCSDIGSMDKNLLVRAATSVFWGGIFLTGLFYGGAAFYFLLFLLAMISSFEWHTITVGNRLFYIPAVFMIALPYTAMAYIYALPHGTIILSWLLVAIWSTDVAAYFLGKSLGTSKIIPSISPNKTWVGLWGGMAFSAISTLVMSMIFGIFFVSHAIVIGVIIAVVAQCGDIAESAIKRVCDVKDSGFIVPGHGGVMDRMDGFIFTAPLVAYYIKHFSKFFIS